MRLTAALGALLKATLVAVPWIRSDAVNHHAFPPLLDATLDDLRAGLDAGAFTSVDLVTAYMARINEVNPALRPVTELNPDALSIAAELDAQRAFGLASGPLHGIPVLVKDNIATRDAMNTTAGSYALLGARVPEDSTVAARLRRAGAVLLGKANLSQWAGARSANASQGWSAYGGQTAGPYFAGQDPSGSSSGSAVAAALGLAWAALGTETAGSVVHPAHVHNLVGVKPTVGLTSRHLVVPVSEHQDTVGPLARTVRDAAALLGAIAGVDGRDNYTSAIPFDGTPDYVAACKASGLRGKRVGVSRDLLAIRTDPTVDLLPAAEFEAALDVLRAAGAEVVDNIALPSLDFLLSDSSIQTAVAGADFITDLARYLGQLETNPNNLSSLADVANFTTAHPLEGFPEHDTLVWDRFLANGFGNDSPEFWGNYTLRQRLAGPEGLTGALANHSLDALAAPTPYALMYAAMLGTPVVTVPMARMPDGTPVVANDFGNLNRTAPNQPVGLGLAGRAFGEVELLGMAYAFEQRTGVRGKVAPCVRPRTELGDVVKGGGEL